MSEIQDVTKWTQKTIQIVERDCNEAGAPCVGIAMVFHDPTADPLEQWKFKIRLAFDPHHPPSDVERKEIEDALNYMAEGVAQIMGGEKRDDLSGYSARGKFH